MARPTKPKDLKPKAQESADAGAAAPDGSGSAPSGGAKPDLKLIITIAAIFIASIVGSAGAMYLLSPIIMEPLIVKSIQKAQSPNGQPKEAAGPTEDKIGNTLDLDEFTVNLKVDPAVGGNQFLRTKISLSIAVPPEEDCNGKTAWNSRSPRAMVASVPGRLAGAAAPILSPSPESVGLLTSPTASTSPSRGEVISYSSTYIPSPLEGASGSSSVSFPSPLEGEGRVGGNSQIYHYSTRNKFPQEELLLAGEGANPTEVCKKGFNEKMAKFMPTIRDIINAALMKRTSSMLASVEGQESLKDEIKEQINQLIGDKYKVIRVNFSDFIIQY